MSFYQKINEIIKYCNQYQQEVEAEDLCFTEPYQSKYLQINKLLKIYSDKKLEIEAVSAGEQSAPGMTSLTPARALYYEMEEKVPPFLESGKMHYYPLQRYKINCMHLLKTFSYSSFKGDWTKIHHLSNWMVEIRGQQEQHNAEASLQKSLEDIKQLGNFDHLDKKELKQLEEEVHNIQTLLNKDPKLKKTLDAEALELFKDAADFLDKNQDLLEELPELDNGISFEEPPIFEIIAYRCRQLIILVDHFHENYKGKTIAKKLFEFKQELNHTFDLTINVCEDIHKAILKEIGAHKKPRIKVLCSMLHKALEQFADEELLFETYGHSIFADYLEIGRGLPDTIDLEMTLLTAIGKK